MYPPDMLWKFSWNPCGGYMKKILGENLFFLILFHISKLHIDAIWRVFWPSNILTIFHLPILLKMLLLVWPSWNYVMSSCLSHVKSSFNYCQKSEYLYLGLIEISFFFIFICLFCMKKWRGLLTLVGNVTLRQTELKM